LQPFFTSCHPSAEALGSNQYEAKGGGNISTSSEEGKTRDIAAAKAGLGSGKTYEAAKKRKYYLACAKIPFRVLSPIIGAQSRVGATSSSWLPVGETPAS
jgi:hypothetical protein